MPTDLWREDAVSLSAALAAGKVTARVLSEMFLQRCEALNPSLNAFVHLDREGALAAADAADLRLKGGTPRGPLDGLPVAVKDNLFVGDMPASWGSLLFEGHRPERDDICVERLRAAGAIIIGKTTTPEFALSGRTESRIAGRTLNPWDLALTPGGSSGGAVAAVAAGMVPLAIGTDAGGSTRMPAGYTGLLGLRPSNGRVPRCYGFPPMALDFQAIGLFARTSRDLDLLYGVLAGPDARDAASMTLPVLPRRERPRLGWFTAVDGVGSDPEVQAAIEQAVERLKAAGYDVTPCTPPYSAEELGQVWGTLTMVGAARVARRFPDRWRSEMTVAMAALVEKGLALPATAYVEAIDRLGLFRSKVSAAWGDFDALIMPTTPAPAWPAGAEHPATIGGMPGSSMHQGMFCAWANAMGFPGLSIPIAPRADGRPIGMQVVARHGGDDIAMDIARSFEDLAPWSDRWPSIAATC